MLVKEFKKASEWQFLLPDVKEILEDIDEKLSEQDDSVIFPIESNIFKAFYQTAFNDVAIVILGQDPYHQQKSNGEEIIPQAMGLSFSVPKGVGIPPSLKNIYREFLVGYPDFEVPDHGELTSWASNGVLLLNTSLTVEESKAGSHAKFGWDKFTKVIIDALLERDKPIVFLSWGRHAHKVTDGFEGKGHVVIKTSHPSPLGARKSGSDFVSFLGSNCFKKANEELRNKGLPVVNFSL